MPQTSKPKSIAGLTLMDRSRYGASETRARDAAWDGLVDGFMVRCFCEDGEWVVDLYSAER